MVHIYLFFWFWGGQNLGLPLLHKYATERAVLRWILAIRSDGYRFRIPEPYGIRMSDPKSIKHVVARLIMAPSRPRIWTQSERRTCPAPPPDRYYAPGDYAIPLNT